MRGRRSVTSNDEGMDINISPLIDMVFILLIFFIVTTVFVEETGVEVEKPEAASAVQLEKNSILIAVTSKGQVVYGRKEIGVSVVRAIIRRLTNKEVMPVIVQVDKGSNAGLVVRVINESKLGGAKNISLSADLP